MYKYYLKIDEVEREVNPQFGDNVRKTFDLESGEVFFREKLGSKVKLYGQEFTDIEDAPFGTRFDFRVSYTPPGESEIPNYFLGYFFKTDSNFDQDGLKVEFELTPDDNYEQILGSLDKEYNLIDLAPEIGEITGRKRPVLQFYIKGSSTITSYYGGNTSSQQIAIDPVTSHTDLINDYYFARGKRFCSVFELEMFDPLTPDVSGNYDPETLSNGTYRIEQYSPASNNVSFRIVRISDNASMFNTQWIRSEGAVFVDMSQANNYQFTPSLSSGNEGHCYVNISDVYVRYLTDLTDVRGTATYNRPVDDIVEGNQGYNQVIGYNIDSFIFYNERVLEPTKFGKIKRLKFAQPDFYFKELLFPFSSGLTDPYPVSQLDWVFGSIWFYSDFENDYTEFIDGEDVEFPVNYSLDSVIRAFLLEIGSPLTFDPDTDHSAFLFAASNPIISYSYLDFEYEGILTTTAGNVKHWITPKSNIMVGTNGNRRGGFQAATIAKITFRAVLQMLKNSMRLFWFVEDGKFRIEHIRYFQNGRSYAGGATVSHDLTEIAEPKTKKPWSFNINKYNYDKTAMPERIEFKWMETVSKAFEGYPIELLSPAVQKGLIEDRSMDQFNADFDFIIISPELVSMEGFCLISTVTDGEIERIPFLEIYYDVNRKIVVQNGFCSMLFLAEAAQTFDLPDDHVILNLLEQTIFYNISRKKIQEGVKFPSISGDPDPISLIKTGLGNGIISKMEINLDSRIVNVTLNHDTK